MHSSNKLCINVFFTNGDIGLEWVLACCFRLHENCLKGRLGCANKSMIEYGAQFSLMSWVRVPRASSLRNSLLNLVAKFSIISPEIKLRNRDRQIWTITQSSKTSISGAPKIPGRPCLFWNCATYGITFMYERYKINSDGSGKSVPLIKSCHIWESATYGGFTVQYTVILRA